LTYFSDCLSDAFSEGFTDAFSDGLIDALADFSGLIFAISSLRTNVSLIDF
jgi:TolB-like protein